MKRIDRKGFTLVELVITIGLIGMIMLLSAPNVVSMVDKNRRMQYIEDAKKIVSLARYQFNKDTKRPAAGYCRIYPLANLDKTNLTTGPKGGNYDTSRSFVIITYNSSTNTYIYNVQLVEVYGDNVKNSNKKLSGRNKTYYRGVRVTDSSNLYKENAKKTYVSDATTNAGYFPVYNSAISCSAI